MKNICKKTITFSIILLLIGVSVSSAISIDTKSPVVNQQREEDCDCKEIDSRHLVRLERQLNRLEIYTKLLSVVSKNQPEVQNNYEEILASLQSINWSYPIICGILYVLLQIIGTINIKVQEFCYKYQDSLIIFFLCSLIANGCIYSLLAIFLTAYKLDCDWATPPT